MLIFLASRRLGSRPAEENHRPVDFLAIMLVEMAVMLIGEPPCRKK
jgi:hypothetical protein